MTGIEHVVAERSRQLEMGWEDHKPHNANGELAACAEYIVDDYLAKTSGGKTRNNWPRQRADHVREKYGTDYVARLRIAAALIAAEIDRIQSTSPRSDGEGE